MKIIHARGHAALFAALAAALCLHACTWSRSVPRVVPAESRSAAAFVGTVERVEYSPLVNSDLNWAIYMKVNRVLSGQYGGDSFTFRVRNPTREGLEVGRAYRVKAVPFGRGYQIVRIEPVKGAPR